MELFSVLVYVVSLFGGFLALKWLLKSVNSWLYESPLGEKRHMLPPGDLGWPFIGVMWSFLKAFKSTTPDSFMDSFVKRYGDTGIYKVFMFGKPSVIVTTPDTCRRVLSDDDGFKPGWPISTVKLIGEKSFTSLSHEDHKRLRKITAAPVNGFEALTLYVGFIEENVIFALDKWSKMGRIEFLTELRRLTFKIITNIFIGVETDSVMKALEKEYTALNYGVRAMAINIPGFVYHRALKARKNLVSIFQSILNKRRSHGRRNNVTKKDMLDLLLEVKDEHGKKLDDEEIIDILVMYLNAGHESSGHTIMWAAKLLQQNPEIFRKAKAEQVEVQKRRPATQKGLTLKEIRQMEYLDKVIDETMRIVTFSLTVFREALKDVKMNGYLIPKGWRVLVWFRSVHFDPEIYPDPLKFDPSRWEGFTPKAGSFLPFGAGSRLCPGNDLAKLEIAIFLHHFLLNYELEQENPGCPEMFLPHRRPKDNCVGRIKKVQI